MATNWKKLYAERSTRMSSSAVREILKITQRPDVISFAGGLPAPEAFPIAAIKDAACRLLDNIGHPALQYSTSEGHPPLRQFIADRMSRQGVIADADNVMITTGSQQSLSLVAELLLDPGDLVVCESPSYLGALQAFDAFQACYATVPIDDNAMQVDEIEPILKKHAAKFIYVLPNFQNPGGTTLSLERRQKLVKIASKYKVPLFEDDPYGELRYEGEYIPLCISLDQQRALKQGDMDNTLDRGNVIYTSTFSKTLAPGLRLGWIIAPHEIIHHLVQVKQSADLHTSTFDQMLAYEVVKEEGFLTAHVDEIREMYRERRNVMLASMEEYFPPGVHWTRPQGGLFLWVTLPEGIDAQALLPEAVAEKVAFVPGQSFFASPDILYKTAKGGSGLPRGHNTMRLNFSNSSPDKIDLGIRSLGRAIEKAIANKPAAPKSRKRKA